MFRYRGVGDRTRVTMHTRIKKVDPKPVRHNVSSSEVHFKTHLAPTGVVIVWIRIIGVKCEERSAPVDVAQELIE